MRALVSLLVAVVIVFAVWKLYLSKTVSEAPGGMSTPTQAISLTGVKNDLNGIAQAERQWFAEKGSYASLDELTSSGALTMRAGGRDGYTYTVETTSNTFTVTARHPATPGVAWPVLQVDQTMEIRTVQ
jgi:hypothetical protein